MTKIRHPAALMRNTAPFKRGLQALGLAARLALACAVPGAATAAVVSGEQMSAVLPGTGSATFAAALAPGLLVTVAEANTATMTGSGLFGFVGLWLGSAGNGGDYSVRFNRPVSRFSLSFVALTPPLGGGSPEWLQSFNTDAASTVLLSSPDASVAWDGRRLTALDEDSRAVLTFTAAQAAGFSQLRFSHGQPQPLNGIVIDRLEFEPNALVPEPASALLCAFGLAGLLWPGPALQRARCDQSGQRSQQICVQIFCRTGLAGAGWRGQTVAAGSAWPGAAACWGGWWRWRRRWRLAAAVRRRRHLNPAQRPAPMPSKPSAPLPAAHWRATCQTARPARC